MTSDTDLRAEILRLVAEYHRERFGDSPFRPGVDAVHYAGRVFDADELQTLVDFSLDFFLTAGRYADQFETEFAEYFGLAAAHLVNSGSSANLVAVTALTSPRLGERRLRAGDEVITVAAGFPTTVAPLVQNRLVPVFVDVGLGDYTAIPARIEEAVGPKTRAIVMAHTMGVPFDLDTVMRLARDHDLWVVEDNCDALGSRYGGRLTGTFGDLSTVSFYPAHHITMGEGGCVLTGNDLLGRIARSIRDWGRDCYCAGGENNTCGKRFSQQFGSLPYGYDHKYVYTHVGYNLKLTDMQAAIGVAQLAKLDGFHRPAQSQLPADPRHAPAVCRSPASASRPAPGRPELVRIRHHRAGRRRVHAGRIDPVPRGQPDRDPQPVQREPAAPAGLPRHRAPRLRRAGQHRRHHAAHVLHRRLSGPRRRPIGLRRIGLRPVHAR